MKEKPPRFPKRGLEYLFPKGSYSDTPSLHSFITERPSSRGDTYSTRDNQTCFILPVQYSTLRVVPLKGTWYIASFWIDDLFLIVGSLCTFCCYRNAWSRVRNSVVLLLSLWYPSVALSVSKPNTVQRVGNACRGVWIKACEKSAQARLMSAGGQPSSWVAKACVWHMQQAFLQFAVVYKRLVKIATFTKVMSIQGFTCTVKVEETISGSWFATNFSRNSILLAAQSRRRSP